MKYFVTVRLLQASTKLGRLLADSVSRRYNNALISHEEANRIPQYLAEEMATLCAEDKHMKPMSVRTTDFGNGKFLEYSTSQISAASEACTKEFTDNRAFTILLTKVLHDYTGEKGGEA